MKYICDRFQLSVRIGNVSGLLLSLVLLTASGSVLAHAGHNHEFQGATEATQTPGAIQVDAEIAKRLGIKVEPVTQQRLDVGIKTTGQIETLPNQKVQVMANVDGTTVELLVKPGDKVLKGQTVAVLSSSELAQLRVEALQKRAEAEADLKEAEANLKLAKENYQHQIQIAEADIAQAETQLAAAQAQYRRDKELVDRAAVVAVAKENYQRQFKISEAEIAHANTELAVAQEKYDRDRDLALTGALPRRQMLEAKAHLEEAKAEVAKALSRQNVIQAESEVKRAEVDLPLRELRESEAKLAEAKAQLIKAKQRREVLSAENQLKRAQAALEVAQSRVRLSNAGYEARLKQLGSVANEKGLVTVVAPISGTVVNREVTPGESVLVAEKLLMTILDDSRVFATANISEKDLEKVKKGQRVNVKVASLPNRTFTSRITLIGSVVEGETRVVPVQAELDNTDGLLKPGMFAELEVITDQTSAALTVVPNSAIVDANGKHLVYVKNGQGFQPVDVTLGRTTGDLVEVKNGLFDGDKIVTQGAIQLYAESLRSGGNKKESEVKNNNSESTTQNFLPLWWVIAAGGAIAGCAFWIGRRSIAVNRKPSAANLVELSIPQMQQPQDSNYHQPTAKL